MQYALLIYRQPGDWDGLGEAEVAELGAEYWKLRAEPGVRDGAGLLGTETATTLRMVDRDPPDHGPDLIEEIFREQWGRVLASQ